MPKHRPAVTALGRRALEDLRTHERLMLAIRVIKRAGYDDDYVLKDLSGMGVFLGDLWAWYGSSERAKVARAADLDATLARIVLTDAGLVERLPDGRLKLDPIELGHVVRALHRYALMRDSVQNRTAGPPAAAAAAPGDLPPPPLPAAAEPVAAPAAPAAAAVRFMEAPAAGLHSRLARAPPACTRLPA
jgi:hypothetical protein